MPRLPRAATIAALILTATTSSPASADNYGESLAWQFKTSADRANQAAVLEIAAVADAGERVGETDLFEAFVVEGVFQADLRLYRVSQPREPWGQVNMSNVDVNVGFANAQVNSVTEEQLSALSSKDKSKAKAIKGGDKLAARKEGDGTRSSSGSSNASAKDKKSPELLQSYMLVGKINKAKMSNKMSM